MTRPYADRRGVSAISLGHAANLSGFEPTGETTVRDMRTWAFAAIAALTTVAFVATLQVGALSDFAVTVISDGSQLLAAVLASAGCAVASLRSEGQRRRAWLWLSVGTGCWAAGQAVWSYYEVVAGQDVPFPSLADLGFLAFPLVGGVGLLIWSGAQGHRALARGRDLMDGAIIAVSLLVLSWVTVMAPIVQRERWVRLLPGALPGLPAR